MFFTLKTKIWLVIFLTVLFSIIDVSISNSPLFIGVVAVSVLVSFVFVLVVSVEKSKKISESVPNFLNFMNLSMSTGKSLPKAFEIAISYQKISNQAFYKYVYQRIFVLNNNKSGLNFEIQHLFYKNIFQILKNSSQQREKIKSLKQLLLKKIEIQRKEKSLRAPFIVQTYIFCILYFALFLWHSNYRKSFPQLEASSAMLFLAGLALSFLVGRSKPKL